MDWFLSKVVQSDLFPPQLLHQWPACLVLIVFMGCVTTLLALWTRPRRYTATHTWKNGSVLSVEADTPRAARVAVMGEPDDDTTDDTTEESPK